MSFDLTKLSIIYAEDEFIFREIALPAIEKAGVPRDNLHIAEDGVGALEHLEKLQGDAAQPLIMLLDVCMPGMDGIECARKVRELSLERPPFMVCCSAGVREVSFEDEEGAFQILLPKPFGRKEVELVIEKVKGWWGQTGVSQDRFEIILADDEPICLMAVRAALVTVGMGDDILCEAENEDEMAAVLRDCQGGDAGKPLVIFLGNQSWVTALQDVDTSKRKPFVVSTSVDSDRLQEGTFDACLLRQFQQSDLKKVLDQCRAAFAPP